MINIIRSNRKGFTLVALIVTIAISAFVIVSSLGVFINSMYLNEISNNAITAANDAQFALEDIKRSTYDNIPNGTYAGPALTNINNTEVITIIVTETVAGITPRRIKDVTVRVDWTVKNRNRTYDLSTRIARP